ncbi:hypothetical protein RFI_15234 [Reticulomyxa filosa]|uniref:Transmembrane protein n=1 Tax=Reticulomyxa filosa TaxID=46433 RepID=X6N7G7_RETFI|nr:hypothetical protein RFI_15234 [Reticulomyxa filosa]|eukprot:ETO21966.1 hypothetical protein RFI_15234 [Reticulomyxa filosa]
MVIVYSVESWFGLYTPQFGLYLDAIRDTYEALVIYSFYQLLIHALGGYEQVQLYLENISIHVQSHVWPMNYCCKPWTFGSENTFASDRGNFLNNCSFGILQYCFIQPICALATFVMQICDVYDEGTFQYDVGYPYIAIIRSVSQTWAIYCLALFYMALKRQPHDSEGYQQFMQLKPVQKFLCVKGVVFFTYWQSVLIAGVVWLGMYMHDVFFLFISLFHCILYIIFFSKKKKKKKKKGWIRSTDEWTEDTIAVGLQDFIICIEMCFAAIAHVVAFAITDFQQCEYAPLLAPHRVMFDVANMGDLVGDARETLRGKTPEML